jgi:DNA polymerase-3 subunit delta
MMAGRRLIRITDVRVAATAFKDTLKEEFELLLAGYLEKPNPSSVVIFVGSELNGNRKITKQLTKYATVVEFAPLQDKELSVWIKRLFDGEGAVAGPETIRHLTAISGSDLVRLSSEIKKLAAASLPSGHVTTELVDQLVPRTREIDSFSLTGLLINSRPEQAVIALKQMLDDGAEPLMLLGLIGSNYRRLIIAKEMMRQGRDSGDLSRAVKLPPNVKEPFLAAARRTELPTLVKAIGRIASTDVAIKNSLGGGTSGARMQIEMLVCELAAET